MKLYQLGCWKKFKKYMCNFHTSRTSQKLQSTGLLGKSAEIRKVDSSAPESRLNRTFFLLCDSFSWIVKKPFETFQGHPTVQEISCSGLQVTAANDITGDGREETQKYWFIVIVTYFVGMNSSHGTHKKTTKELYRTEYSVYCTPSKFHILTFQTE
jgi:hypothetical protein